MRCCDRRRQSRQLHGLNITNRMFKVMGARATSGQYRFDRYWRNIRTFTSMIRWTTVRDVGNGHSTTSCRHCPRIRRSSKFEIFAAAAPAA